MFEAGFCGNQMCDMGETCESCPADCRTAQLGGKCVDAMCCIPTARAGSAVTTVAAACAVIGRLRQRVHLRHGCVQGDGVVRQWRVRAECNRKVQHVPRRLRMPQRRQVSTRCAAHRTAPANKLLRQIEGDGCGGACGTAPCASGSVRVAIGVWQARYVCGKNGCQAGEELQQLRG